MIRASGGRVAVKVWKDTQPVAPNSGRAWMRLVHGAWRWSVPEPKGHPRKPRLETLSGTAHSHADAVAVGLWTLREVYGVEG